MENSAKKTRLKTTLKTLQKEKDNDGHIATILDVTSNGNDLIGSPMIDSQDCLDLVMELYQDCLRMAYLLLAVSKPSDRIRVWVQVLLLELYRVLMVVIAVQSILNSHLSSVLRIRIATTLGRMMHMASKDLKRRADTLI